MTESGAATFAYYWAQVSDYAALTGDVSVLEEISSPNCSACQRFIDLYRTTYEDGGWFLGGQQSFSKVSVRKDSARKFFVYAEVTAADARYKANARTDPKMEPGGRDDLVYKVTWVDGRWLMQHQALEEKR